MYCNTCLWKMSQMPPKVVSQIRWSPVGCILNIAKERKGYQKQSPKTATWSPKTGFTVFENIQSYNPHGWNVAVWYFEHTRLNKNHPHWSAAVMMIGTSCNPTMKKVLDGYPGCHNMTSCLSPWLISQETGITGRGSFQMNQFIVVIPCPHTYPLHLRPPWCQYT